MKQLTEGSVSKITDGMISIKQHLNAIGLQDKSEVLIIRSRSGFLRVIPIISNFTVHVRVSLDLGSFTEASHILYARIRQSDIRLLHSTGFCPLEDSCLWEGYFAIQDKDKIEEFIAWLRSLDVVHEVETVYLTGDEYGVTKGGAK